MFTKLKNATALMVIVGALAGCATQPPSAGMNMDSGMCKKMMEQGKCGCCQHMSDMRTSGMMSGGQPMQCMPQGEKKSEPFAEKQKTPDAAEHKAHHPENAQ